MDREFSVERALKEVDGLVSLETARMTLRWALERLRLLESRMGTAEARAEGAARAAVELQRERDHAKKEEQRVKTLAAGLEARLSELGTGGRSAAAQARVEAELAEREAGLKIREERLREQAEKDRLTAEQELRAARDRADREAKAKLDVDREEQHRSLARAREELAARLVSYHEDEVRLRVRQKAVEERAATLEAAAASHKIEIERTAAAQAEMQQQAARSHLDAEIASLQTQWASERKLLLDELTAWRGRARSLIPELVSLGDRLYVAEEEDTTLKTSLERARETARRAEGALQEERDHRRAEAGQLTSARAEAADAARRVEELQAELRAQTRRAENVTLARDGLAAALLKREEALVRLEDILTSRLVDAEKLLISRYDAWAEHEAASRRQGSAWLNAIDERRKQADVALEQIGRLRRELIDEIGKRRETPSPGTTKE